MCSCRLGMGGVSQGSALALGLFCVFPNDTGSGSISPSACLQGLGELSGVGAPRQDLDMHRNLDKLEKWETTSSDNLMKSHKAKCQVLHLVWDNS